MNAAYKEFAALAACATIGGLALGTVALLDRLTVNPDVLLGIGAGLAALGVVGLALATNRFRPRFLFLGLTLGQLVYWVAWMAIASYNTARTHG